MVRNTCPIRAATRAGARWLAAAACLAPSAGLAQGRGGAPVVIPHIPPAVSRAPQIPVPPQIPSAPRAVQVPRPPHLPPVPRGLPASAAATAGAASAASAARAAAPGQARAAVVALAHGPASEAQGTAADAPALSTGQLQRNRDKAAAAPVVLALNGRGELVLRGQVLALSPSAEALDHAKSQGFAVIERSRLRGVGLDVAVLLAPAGLTADEALARLRAADPDGAYDLNPVYETMGAAKPLRDAPAGGRAGSGRPVNMGLIDTGVAVAHPALARSRIVQKGFAAGGPTPGEHGTAIASLVSGEAGRYHGAAPGSTLYVADVYGAGPGGGGASAVVRALDWLVTAKAPVVNISLVGPANRALEAAIDGAVAKGVVVVAAVGNDGPLSPPLYPAAYRNVVAVTGVDRRNAVLPEAVRATPVAFAAPGADIAAARPGGGFASVRGTSFAAPIVAAEIAMEHRRLDAKDAAAALQRLQQRAARDSHGGAAVGWGLVGVELRPALANPGAAAISAQNRTARD